MTIDSACLVCFRKIITHMADILYARSLYVFNYFYEFLVGTNWLKFAMISYFYTIKLPEYQCRKIDNNSFLFQFVLLMKQQKKNNKNTSNIKLKLRLWLLDFFIVKAILRIKAKFRHCYRYNYTFYYIRTNIII